MDRWSPKMWTKVAWPEADWADAIVVACGHGPLEQFGELIDIWVMQSSPQKQSWFWMIWHAFFHLFSILLQLFPCFSHDDSTTINSMPHLRTKTMLRDRNTSRLSLRKQETRKPFPLVPLITAHPGASACFRTRGVTDHGGIRQFSTGVGEEVRKFGRWSATAQPLPRGASYGSSKVAVEWLGRDWFRLILKDICFSHSMTGPLPSPCPIGGTCSIKIQHSHTVKFQAEQQQQRQEWSDVSVASLICRHSCSSLPSLQSLAWSNCHSSTELHQQRCRVSNLLELR